MTISLQLPFFRTQALTSIYIDAYKYSYKEKISKTLAGDGQRKLGDLSIRKK